MRSRFLLGFVACIFTASLMAPHHAEAQTLRIEIENLGASDDFFLTPLWVGLHDGSFDLFDLGGNASAGLQLLAEEGEVGMVGTANTLASEFAAPGRLQSVAADPTDFGSMGMQPPVIDPGNTAVTEININNPLNYRYFSFASMIIPSNDAFIGNENPFAHELFDTAGNFVGPVTIDITGSDIFDAGTEDNDGQGAAFSANAGTGTDTIGGSVSQGPDLTNFIGTDTVAGTTIARIATDAAFARITISVVPEPGSLTALLALGTFGLLRRRR